MDIVVFYVREDGLLFIQYGKKFRDLMKTESRRERLNKVLRDGTVVEGKPVRVSKTGLILDKWSIYHDARTVV